MGEPEEGEIGREVQNPHDKFFREYFSDPETAAGFLKSALKPSLAERKQSVWLYMLWEHQKRPDRWMAFRMLEYQVAIWRRWLRQERNEGERFLRPIYSIVLYQGAETWNQPRNFHDLIDWKVFTGEDLRALTPDFEFDLFQLVTEPAHELPTEPLARAGLELMRALVIGDPLEWLCHNGPAIEQWLRESGRRDRFLVLVSYLIHADRDLPAEKFQETIRQLPSTTENDVMSLYEQILEKGRAEGIEKGKSERDRAIVLHMAEEGFEVEQIRRATQLNESVIREILAKNE